MNFISALCHAEQLSTKECFDLRFLGNSIWTFRMSYTNLLLPFTIEDTVQIQLLDGLLLNLWGYLDTMERLTLYRFALTSSNSTCDYFLLVVCQIFWDFKWYLQNIHCVLFSLQGNLNWMRSREATLQSPVWRGREHEIAPFGDHKASDSANLDSTAEVRDHTPFTEINSRKLEFHSEKPTCIFLFHSTSPEILLLLLNHHIL